MTGTWAIVGYKEPPETPQRPSDKHDSLLSRFGNHLDSWHGNVFCVGVRHLARGLPEP